MIEAGVMLVIKDGLILGVSRRDNKTKFGFAGGKMDPHLDKDSKDAAIRETLEETGIRVNDCVFFFERTDDKFHSSCYYALDWEGKPTKSEEGEVEWLTAEEMIYTKAAFGNYNRNALKAFKKKFPHIYIKGNKL